MDFREAWQYLDSLQQHKIKLGLEAMECFLDRVQRPDRKLRFVHVAGTNGKGSVAVNLVTMLGMAGYRVGLFTSPHLSSVRERFRINDQFISEEAFARIASTVKTVLADGMITYFEFTTALALLWFVEEDVDLVVLETGLGGRLDATNVVMPMVSVITNVSMDHEAYLGTTLSSIAREKAGIIKSGVPVVTGVVEATPLSVISERCAELSAPLFRLGTEFSHLPEDGKHWCWQGHGGWRNVSLKGLCCAMKGDYQRDNASLAIAVIQLLKEQGFAVGYYHLRKALQQVRWPGRLEYLASLPGVSGRGHVSYLLDGAHNPAGVASLVATLKNDYSYRRLIVVWGAMEDKDLAMMLPVVAGLASKVILTRPQGERAATPERLLAVVPEELRSRCLLVENVEEALLRAEQESAPEDLIVVAGSLYLLGEVRSLLVGELVDG